MFTTSPAFLVKHEFDHLRERKTAIDNKLQTFWVSNDHFSLGEALWIKSEKREKVRETKKLPAASEKKEEKEETAPFSEKKRETSSKEGTLFNLFVAESDIFSNTDIIEGDIIICDIDRRLLAFIEGQKKFLLSLYENYRGGLYDFEDALAEYKKWFHTHTDRLYWLHQRIDRLAQFHLFYNEDKFIQCLSALKKKQLITLDINLFDEQEQNDLVYALHKANAKVKLFNLTNLPDYDENNSLLTLMDKIPWADNPDILWNIHDRGALPLRDRYIHYLFFASTPSEYRTLIEQQPDFFADLDKNQLSELIEDPEFDIIRYADNPKKRGQYFTRYYAKENLSQEQICQKYKVACLPRSESGMVFFQTQNDNFLNILQQVESLPCIQSNMTCIYSVYSILNEIKNFPLDAELGQLKFKKELERAQFLLSLAKCFSKVNIKLHEIYKNNEDLPVRTFLHDQMNSACKNRTLTLDVGREKFKKDLIKNAEAICQHRLLDTKKHYVTKWILNVFMLIPVFGGIKYAITGSYFFHAKTRRERVIQDTLKKVTTPTFSRGP